MSTIEPQKRILALVPEQPAYRFLIVDDKPLNRQLLIKLLAPLGFTLKEATNGAEAVELWQSWQPHLTWMDMRMPVLNGYEATKQIRQLPNPFPEGKCGKIVAVTASMFEEERAIVLAVGCDDFLRKPFREESIFEMLVKHLGVEFIYEEVASEPTPVSHGDLTPEMMTQIPRSRLEPLHNAIVASNLQQIAKSLDQIATDHPEIAKVLKLALDQFEYERVLELISEESH